MVKSTDWYSLSEEYRSTKLGVTESYLFYEMAICLAHIEHYSQDNQALGELNIIKCRHNQSSNETPNH